MSKRLSTLLLALVMVLTFVVPALAETSQLSGVLCVTRGGIEAVFPTDIELLPGEGSAQSVVTQQEAASFLLRQAGMTAEQLGIYPADHISMADSIGMIDDSFAGDQPCSVEQFETMQASAGLAALTEALSADKLEPLFINGMAQPIFPYTTGANDVDYSNETSNIIRFLVYVETDYDTDGDGKLDLVQALVQLPRAAAEGDYQAATIYEARPYITGCTPLYGEDDEVYGDEGYDIASMYAQPAARDTATSTIDSWESSQAFVNAADSKKWYYCNPFENMMDYEDLQWYDYYLVRGFAVVECAGLGTRGSEGFETCGADLEIAAFESVIDWLAGNGVAYTDHSATTAVEAYWSNKSVGMTGRSYAGTTQFGLATTGVEGLKTIVPVAGISSWYEYTNAQGISTSGNPAYSDALAGYCAGALLDSTLGATWATDMLEDAQEKLAKAEEKGEPTDTKEIDAIQFYLDNKTNDFDEHVVDYGNYLGELVREQVELNSDYGEHWAIRDYTLDAEKINCPALIVHGFNDYNVRTKMFEQMYDAYVKAGQPVKLLLHQDGHLTPTYPAGNLVFDIGDQTYDEILNKWFSHYLYGVDNGIENMAAVTAQDSHDASVWNTYDSWEAAESVILKSADTATINSDYSAMTDTSNRWWGRRFNLGGLAEGSTALSAMYTADVAEDIIIKGSVAVDFSAIAANLDGEEGTAIEERDALMVSAMLVDIAPEGETFPVFQKNGSYVPKTTLAEAGAWMGGGLKNFDLTIMNTTDVSYNIISRGWMDLANPGAGFDSASAARTEKVTLGAEYDYTLYMQPTIYEVAAGHTLALVVYTYEPGMGNYDQNYQITLTKGASAIIPVDGAGAELDAALAPVVVKTAALDVAAGENGTVEATVANGDVNVGTSVTVTAKANAGYRFEGWTVNDQASNQTESTATFAIYADTKIVANFAKIEVEGGSVSYNVTVDTPANGEISTSTVSSAEGGKLVITTNAADGYQLDTLTVTVSATFEPIATEE